MKLTNLLTLLGIGCISPLLPSHAHPTEPKAVLPYIIDNIIDNNKPNIININITYINTTIPQSAESIATAKHIPTAETTIATTKKTNGLACRFNVFWTSNWRDWGYHRYRVAAVTEGDKDGRDTAEDLLNRWCYHFRCEIFFSLSPPFLPPSLSLSSPLFYFHLSPSLPISLSLSIPPLHLLFS